MRSKKDKVCDTIDKRDDKIFVVRETGEKYGWGKLAGDLAYGYGRNTVETNTLQMYYGSSNRVSSILSPASGNVWTSDLFSLTSGQRGFYEVYASGMTPS